MSTVNDGEFEIYPLPNDAGYQVQLLAPGIRIDLGVKETFQEALLALNEAKAANNNHKPQGG